MPDPTAQISESGIADEYHFCTYFDRNYLPRGLALYHSLARHCQRPFTLWVLCFDDETYHILSRLNLPGVRLISQQDFEAGDEALVRAKADRSRVEYYWTCTPSLPLYVLRHNSEVEVITYLDADLYFYSDPQPIYDEFEDGSILIIEHRYAPEHAQLAATSGIYNVGLMAFRQDNHGLVCLDWWRERCLEWCYTRFEDGKFGDQKYLDDWPARFRGVVVLQHKGAGLAPWNLTRYRVEFGTQNIAVDEQPLIFYHFHGYKPVSRCVVEPAGYGYRISPEQALKLYLPYVHALQEAEAQVARLLPHTVANVIPRPTGDIVSGLLEQRFLLVQPQLLSLALWHVGGWRRANQARVESGFVSHAAGDLPAARRHFLAAVCRNPLLLRNLGIISILLESLVGPVRMNRYRHWRRRLWMKAQQG